MQSSGTATSRGCIAKEVVIVIFFGTLSAPVFVNLADFSLTIFFTRMLVYIQLLKQQ
jgi:hypothetical protein